LKLKLELHTPPRFAFDLLAAMPGRGGGLHNWLFRVARLFHPYRNEDEIIKLLRAATAEEAVKPGEIEDAVARSKAAAWAPGQPSRAITAPAWPAVDRKARDAIIQSGGGVVDLWEASPIRIDDNDAHTEELVDALFPGDPLLCCGLSDSKFDTRSREEWRGQLNMLQLIAPNPMTARAGLTQNGKQSAHALSITGPRRFLVVEFDQGNVNDHAALLWHLAQKAPLALVVHSGSKSLHGWFFCAGQPEERLRPFMRLAVSLGADPATWTRSQFVRMPDGTREGGKPQTVYYFAPGVVK
jgi:hypothetical protein